MDVDRYHASRANDNPELHSDQPIDQQIVPDFHRVTITDARPIRDAPSIDREGRPVPSYRRVALYQTWRTLSEAPHDNTLAICDARTVSPDSAIPLQTYTPGDGKEPEKIEVRLCTWEPQHRWYYFSDMEPHGILVFKGCDSADPQGATGAHTGFADPTHAHPSAHMSVEARFLVVYH